MASSNLRTRYIAALAAVALLSITGQVLVQTNLTTQENDSAIINLAGRQRMLSQRIVKTALIGDQPAPVSEPARQPPRPWRERLAALVDEWRRAHRGLRAGDPARGLSWDNSAEVRAAFRNLEASYQGMNRAVDALLQRMGDGPDAIVRLLDHEREFLRGMEGIVSLYERESADRVRFLQRIELGLVGLVLLTLLLEGLLVFRPAERRIDDTLRRLRAGEAEKSAILRAIPDTLVRVDREGSIAASYAPLGEADLGDGQRSVRSLVGERQFARCLGELERTVATGQETGFEFSRATDEDTQFTEARLVPCEPDQALLILRDISARRRLEQELLQVAERERARIGQDLHDGLCQHLAGLTMMAQTLSKQVASGRVIDAADIAIELKTLASLLQTGLRGARELSRGLFPEVLVERGLEAALREVCATASALHKVECVPHVELGSLDVERDIAMQLYRIAQEAVGNAVRHARAGHVDVSLRHEDAHLHLEIADDGVGFLGATDGVDDVADADVTRSSDGSGRESGGLGLRSMAMRAHTIGAEFSVRDNRPAGTLVTCRLPLER